MQFNVFKFFMIKNNLFSKLFIYLNFSFEYNLIVEFIREYNVLKREFFIIF